MRNGQNNKRMRGRNRKSHNPLTRVYESNGPEVKVRGTASHIAEKYMQLARDAQTSGDPVGAENYLQHAEHYLRLIAAAQEQFRPNQPGSYFRSDSAGAGNEPRDDVFDDGDDDGLSQGTTPGTGEQPAFGTRDPQPYLPQDAQFFSPRDQSPREQSSREQSPREPSPREQSPRESSPREPSPRDQQGGRQSASKRHEDDSGVDRLPSFITGGAPQPSQAAQGQNGSNEGQGGGADRFPLHRRRRRHRSPRGELPAQNASEGGDDAAPQSE